MANEFWMSDRQWAALAPLIPMNRCGVKLRRNLEVIGGIVHVLRAGFRWRDCPEVYGTHTTIYNRLNRWSKADTWQTMLEALVDPGIDRITEHRQHNLQGASLPAVGKGAPKSSRSGAAAAGRRPSFMPPPPLLAG